MTTAPALEIYHEKNRILHEIRQDWRDGCLSFKEALLTGIDRLREIAPDDWALQSFISQLCEFLDLSTAEEVFTLYELTKPPVENP